ncbi:unnamed protein product [Prunus armeniaca]
MLSNLQFSSLLATIHWSCLLMMVADHQVRKCLRTYRVVPRCTRRDSWLICIALSLKLTSRSSVPPRLRPYLMTCMSSWRSLQLTMRLFFGKVFRAMEYALSQCTLNVYWAIMCFENLNCFFKLDLTMREFFYFFKVRHYEKSAEGGKARSAMVRSFLSPTVMIQNDICKKQDLGPDMAKVCWALNIPARIPEWRWLLSEYWEKDGGLLPTKDVEKWKQYDPDSDDLPTERDESSTEHPEKWKADARSSKDEARTSWARDVSLVIKFSLKEASSAEKTQVGAPPSSFARIKHLVSVDSKKIGGMQNVRGILLKSLTDKLKTCNLPCKESRDEDRTGRTSPPPNHRNLVVEPRVVKHGADSKSLTPLEVRMAAAKKARELSTWASPTLQGMHSSDLGTFLSLSLEKQKEAILSELEKKNVDMTSKLSVEQVRHETRILEIKESVSLLKSSLAKKDSELNSSVATLHSCKLLVEFEAYHKATEQSKFEVVIDVYKLGYMDCKSGVAPCYSIEDEDIETFCLNMPSTQSERINVVDIGVAEEQVVNKTVAEEDDVEEDTKEVAEHGSPTKISQ